MEAASQPLPVRTAVARGATSSTAWATVFWGSEDLGLKALLVLGWAARRQSDRPFLVLCKHDLPGFLLAKLRQQGFLPVPLVVDEKLGDRNTIWLRIQLWSMVQFERIVYLDTDCLPVADLDIPSCKLLHSPSF